MNIFRFPSSDPLEVLNMATLQFVRSTPHKRADLAVDAKILESPSPNHSLVLGVMTTRDMLKPYLNILEQARLKPDVLTVNAQRLVSLSRAVWSNDFREEARVIGLGLDGALYWGLVAGGVLMYSHEEQDGADVVSSFGSFADYCRKEFPNTRIQDGILLGNSDRVGVSRQISGVTIEVQELSSLVRSARERSAFDLSPIAYLDLLLAQDDRDMSFDLSPENLRTERDCSKARSLAAHFAIIAGIFLAGLLLRAGLEWHQRSAVVVSLRTALESTSTRVKELEDKAQRVAAVERQVSDRILVSAVFQSLSKNIPPGVRLNDADLKDGILNILGEADGLEAAQALLTALASAEDFRDVRLEGIDKRPSEAAQVVSFRIKLKVQR